MSHPLYGIGYQPLEGLTDFDPFGIRKKVDNYVEQKAQRAANLAEQRVEAGVRRAVGDAGKSAALFVGGGLLVGLVAGGIYYYRRAKDRR